MKKTILVILMTLMTVSVATTAYAAPSATPTMTQDKVSISQSMKIEDTKNTTSKVLSFNEVVAKIAATNNTTQEEAKRIVIGEPTVVNTLGVEQTDSEIVKNAVSLNEKYAVAALATYREVTTNFTVNSSYIPSLLYYCQSNEGGGSWGIVKILNVGMNRQYTNSSKITIIKEFGGSVYTNLENAGTIYWSVNGTFYNNGTTTVGGGVNINIGEAASVNFSASYATNFYAYCVKSGRYIIQ